MKTDILYPAKKRVLSCHRTVNAFPKDTYNGDIWKYEREWDRLNCLLPVDRSIDVPNGFINNFVRSNDHD